MGKEQMETPNANVNSPRGAKKGNPCIKPIANSVLRAGEEMKSSKAK
jgi:hypothetical protein